MRKVIKIDRRIYNGKQYNNIFKINNELAIAKDKAVFNYIPKRKSLRRDIINLHNSKYKSEFPVTHRDIKRMERPDKCEIPVNIMSVLEVIITEICLVKTKFSYRAQDNSIISCHALEGTVELLNLFDAWLNAHEVGERPECDKYRTEVAYVIQQIKSFDARHPGVFNSLFNGNT